MKNLRSFNNPYRDDKVFEGCAIFALLNQAGKNVSGEPVFRAIAVEHEAAIAVRITRAPRVARVHGVAGRATCAAP